MQRLRKRTAIVMGAICASIAVPSFALDRSFHFKAGYDAGGDTLVTVLFSNGETQKIKANQGFFFGGGVSLVDAAKNIEAELSLSYKFDGIEGSNGEVWFDRLALEALIFHRFPTIRLGGGITYSIAPQIDGKGVASGVDAEFKNGLGFVCRRIGG